MSWHHRRRRAHRRGFSLIELMIAIAILAIIVSVALPGFMDSLRKGRRAEGVGALAFIQQQQERWRAVNPTYSDNLSTAWPTGLGVASPTANGRYTLTLDNTIVAPANRTTYIAMATAAGSQASDTRCAILAVRQLGGQISYGSGSSSIDWTDANGCWAK